MERLSLIGTLTTLSPSLSFDNAPQQQLPKLPFDLVIEILSWLPVKSLLRLRCVCKSWNSLISADVKFAEKHLHASTKRNRYRLILTSMNYSDELVFCDSTVPSFANPVCTTTTTTGFTLNKYHPIPYYGFRTGLGVSSCDGIVCCPINQSSALLCNPFTRKLKLLPPFEIPFDYTLYSFGYHHFTKTYKVVAVSRNVDENLPETNYVSVHTLGTDFWRKIEDFPSYAYIPSSGIFVSNRVNWLAYDGRLAYDERVIISLDLDTDSYHELLQPNYGTVNGILAFPNFYLGVLRDCLCILSRGDTSTGVWLMKEYGNEDSWTKLFNLPYIYMDDGRPCLYTKIVCISEDDQVLLLEFIEYGEGCLVLYDSKNNTFKDPEIQNTNSSLVASKVCIERLISPFS